MCGIIDHSPRLRRIRAGILLVFCAGCAVTGPPDFASLAAELDTTIPGVIGRGKFPSIQVAVIRGQDIWSRAYGTNTSTAHVYMNASVQKVFTAAAVMQLVERGLIDLDADVGDYMPFPVSHPGYPDTPITVRMLLAHRAGLDAFRYQFEWDTESVFAPEYRPAAPADVQALSQEGYLMASLSPRGSNFDPRAWIHEPGREYHYSVSAYPLLRYVIGRVSGQSYAAYMRENIFLPLDVTRSGFSATEFASRHATPYTRMDGENIELPVWDGQGSMMHATAEDMARFMAALMNGGRYGDIQLLQPESIVEMQRRTTRFTRLSFFKGKDDLVPAGHGLGLFVFRGGWMGYGGSAPGFQCLFRYNPSKQVGYVIMSNVNAILSGGENYASARSDLFEVQDGLISILDPLYGLHRLMLIEVGFLGVVGAYIIIVIRLWVRRRNAKRPGGVA